MIRRLIYLTLSFLLISNFGARAQEVVNISDLNTIYSIGKNVSILEDKKGDLRIENVTHMEFVQSTAAVPNMQITPSAFWVKIALKNETDKRDFLIEVNHPTIDNISLFIPEKNKNSFRSLDLGENQPFAQRFYQHQSYIFPVDLPKDSVCIYYIRIEASEQLQLPISVGHTQTIVESFFTKDLVFGLYAGIILVMAVYNLFIFFTVRDKNYLYYVAYIVFVGLTQAMLQGYTFRYFWPNTLWLNNFSAVMIPFLNGIAALEFIRRFLNVPKVSKRYNRGITYIEIFYCLSFVLGIIGQYIFAQMAVQGAAFVGSIFVFALALKFTLLKEPTAKFFLIAWSIFLVSVFVFVLRNFNVLPYNDFTYYALQIGSAMEVTLLSFALANKINIYRKEKEESQAEALRESQEKEKLISEQNVMLEIKVEERTHELHETNVELESTLHDLKQTQSQLVDAEKMASLGQLTAGIAHEINNPINFVSSNINPLKRDVEDILAVISKYDEIIQSKNIDEDFKDVEKLKKELDFDYLKHEIDILLKGMDDGASRTVEIVKGLKSFSRLDESDLKFANINEGIDSTLIILNSSMKGKVHVTKELGAIPEIECFAGKLNQVFMNIINNAGHAVMSNPETDGNGEIIVKTYQEGDSVIVRIKDTGIGMSADVKDKIFEPFYTTKKAGEGTGLGLSITFSIIELHHGTIKVESEPGKGTEFIISLPIVQD